MDKPAIQGIPRAENCVYLLLGLLWDELPQEFSFLEFEVDPYKQGYSHKKWLDARGEVKKDDEWEKVTFEFKLESKGLMRDVERYPDFYADWLICWDHNAPAAEKYVGEILSLRQIYEGLSEEEKERVKSEIIDLDFLQEDVAKPSTDEVLARFSDDSRAKVKKLIEEWDEYLTGLTELKFVSRGVTQFRAAAYSSEHIIVRKKAIDIEVIEGYLKGKEYANQQETVRIPLGQLSKEDLFEFISLLKQDE